MIHPAAYLCAGFPSRRPVHDQNSPLPRNEKCRGKDSTWDRDQLNGLWAQKIDPGKMRWPRTHDDDENQHILCSAEARAV